MKAAIPISPGLKAIGIRTTGQRILMGSTILTALTSCLKIEAVGCSQEDHAGQEIQTTVTHFRVTYGMIVLTSGLEITWAAAPPKFGATPVVHLHHMGGMVMHKQTTCNLGILKLKGIYVERIT
jgi:hypothetical protein